MKNTTQKRLLQPGNRGIDISYRYCYFHASRAGETMITNIWTLLAIMVVAGAFGGLINYFIERRDSPDKSSILRSLVVGIGASFLVPLFLNMISSDLMRQMDQDVGKLLVFVGFCLIAAITSSASSFVKQKRPRMRSKRAKGLLMNHLPRKQAKCCSRLLRGSTHGGLLTGCTNRQAWTAASLRRICRALLRVGILFPRRTHRVSCDGQLLQREDGCGWKRVKAFWVLEFLRRRRQPAIARPDDRDSVGRGLAGIRFWRRFWTSPPVFRRPEPSSRVAA
jgi:hypothetical protein